MKRNQKPDPDQDHGQERRATRMSAKETSLEQFLKQCGDGVVMVENSILGAIQRIPHLKHDHPPVENVNDQMSASFTPLERVALFITQRVGSMGFFLTIATWSAVWLLWNTLAPRPVRFDPAPAFVMWLFISNLIQISLMPLIMVGQNLLNRHAEFRSEEDFKVNLTAEKEARAILLHLERQAGQIERQGELILEILRHLENGAEAAPVPSQG
jgi:uncharacterized membrane protein